MVTLGPWVVVPSSARRARYGVGYAVETLCHGGVLTLGGYGLPVSPPMRMRGSISISPRTGTPYSRAVLAPSPWPKMSMGFSQWGAGEGAHVLDYAENFYVDLRNISMALRTSANATVDGVVTTTAPVTATVWISVNCTSPVPGGRSIRR